MPFTSTPKPLSKPCNQASSNMKKIEDLNKRQNRIKAQIDLLQSQFDEQERKKETRRKILAGAWVYKEMAAGNWATVAHWMMEAGMLREMDRALFGLQTIEVTEN